jgi:PAS domain S-box-containing protein
VTAPLAATDADDALSSMHAGPAVAAICQNADGAVIAWNTAAEELFGHSAAEIIGSPAAELFPERSRTELRAACELVLAGSPAPHIYSWQPRGQATAIPLDIGCAPVYDAAGTVIAVLTTVEDLSASGWARPGSDRPAAAARSQAAAFERLQDDLEQLAHAVSHDLSEPVRVTSGFVGLLEDRIADALDERARRYLQHIVEANDRMAALIDGLRIYSRSLLAPPVWAVIDTMQVLSRVLRQAGPDPREREMTVELASLPPVLSDPRQLEVLFGCLVDNASKFSREPGGRIEISATADEEWVTFTVDDDGIGIPAGQRDRAFRLFQQLHHRSDYSGVGMGLAIARQIVESREGRIWIEDSPLGGTRICCTVPALGQFAGAALTADGEFNSADNATAALVDLPGRRE